PPPRCTLFPYTTLFRSRAGGASQGGGDWRDWTRLPLRLLAAGRTEDGFRAAARYRGGCAEADRDSYARGLGGYACAGRRPAPWGDRKSTRLNSSHLGIS